MRVSFTFTPAAQPNRAGDDDRAFGGRLSQAAPAAAQPPADAGQAGGPAAPCSDWPLVAGGRCAPTMEPPRAQPAAQSPGRLVAAPPPHAGTGLRAVFQQAADAAVSRVDHREAFRAPPPQVFPQPAFPQPTFPQPAFPTAFPTPRPAPVDPRAAIDEAVRAGAAVAQGAFGGVASSGAALSPGADALAAAAEAIRASMQANIARDASTLSVADAMRADLERAASELGMAEARIGAMLDNATGGSVVDPKERAEMIAKAREQAQQKIRDIAKALDPARDDKAQP